MKKLLLAVCAIGFPLVASALFLITSNATWDLYKDSTRLGSYASQTACAQAALARGVVGTYTCRTSTIVTVSGTVTAPTLSLAASPTSVSSGGSSTLSWSSTNATSCAAGGAWSGTKATSGSQSTGPLAAAASYVLTCTGAGGSITRSVSVAVTAVPAGQISGLEWSGNESTNTRRMLYWSRPFPIYDATYVFRVFPKGPKVGPNAKYWTLFFWGNNGDFIWNNGRGDTYYGAHPYPNPAPDGTSQPWEIAVYSSDYLGPVPVWNRWYTQVFRAWRESASTTHHEFIYDYDLWISSGRTQGIIKRDIVNSSWAVTNPPKPAIVVGQAPKSSTSWVMASWGGYVGYEEYKGIIRGIQFYNARLSDAQLAAELAAPGSARRPWYLNLNPSPSDVSDKSGSGNHPAWEGTTARLWQP